MAKCDKCGGDFYAGDGVWDDGDSICGECLADMIAEAEEKDQSRATPKPAIRKAVASYWANVGFRPIPLKNSKSRLRKISVGY